MASFDMCCPGQNKAPDSPAKIYPNDHLSDEDSSVGPAPPPPDEPHPDHYDERGIKARSEKYPNGDKFRDEYDDDVDRDLDMEKGSDPPQETTTELSDEEHEDDESVDFEEDQSVEIPPTKVVQRMMDDDYEKGGGFTLLCAGLVACCLVIAALVLGIGFGTGAFSKEENTSRGGVAPTDPDAFDPTLDGSGGDEPDIEVPPVVLEGLPAAEFIAAVSLAEPAVFENLQSPEYLALNWIATEIEIEALAFDTNLQEDQTRLAQTYALLTLWYSSADAWVDESNWLVALDECTWAGVICDANGVVTDIDMNSNGLTGSIPEDIGLLANMQTLTLSGNNLVSPLPGSLFSMTGIGELYLDNNLFDDELTNVSQWTGLTVLFANGNNLSGDIGIFWALSNLEVLVLDDNSFSGSLVGVSALVDLSKCFRLGWTPCMLSIDMVLTIPPPLIYSPLDARKQRVTGRSCAGIW
jgi:hypothetical protein